MTNTSSSLSSASTSSTPLDLSSAIRKYDGMIEEYRNNIDRDIALAQKEVNEQTEIMQAARREGDLRENAAFHAAKEALVKAESGLRALSRTQQVLLDETLLHYTPDGFIGQGTTVVLTKIENGHEVFTKIIRLVQKEIAKAEEGLVSLASPVGKALEGREPNCTIQVKSNSKILTYQIKEVH